MSALNTYKTTFPWSYFQNIEGNEDLDNPNDIPATGITLTPSTPTELKVGDSLQLTATVSPDYATDKTVTWISSNTSVATINQQGLVTAVATGTAVITVYDAYGHSASVTITVIDSDDSGVETVVSGAEKQSIFTLNGILIKREATPEDIEALTPGIYIIGGRKIVVK